ncbi:lipopolysaccharide biosynthesis protein [Heyndrickxia coagulans]|uniref:lipopolysaccharide biosynthesis protein n=1 Tax=Heyndrickxia coagulans TaxID=1398 RepID=UPI003D255C63
MSKKVKYNIILNGILKFISICLQFVLIRETFWFLKSEEVFGVWMTILTLLGWFELVNLGIGNGLRNKITEIYYDIEKIKEYISTAYTISTIISAVVMILYLLFFRVINWQLIFNTKSISHESLNLLFSIIIISYLAQMVFQLLNSICFANQDAVYPSLFPVISNLIIIIFIFFLRLFKNTSEGNIILLGTIYGLTTLGVLFFANIFFFKTKYKRIKPQISHINFKHSTSLMNTGIKFLILQLCAAVIFTTDSIIITNLLGPVEVSKYQLVYKLFNVFNVISMIIMTPLWSAFSLAYSKNDYKWIKSVLMKLLYLMIPVIIGIGVLALTCKKIIYVWMGTNINISYPLIIIVALYTFGVVWSNVFSYILNGLNRINLQLSAMIFGAIINIPLSILFVEKYNFGICGVVAASFISLLTYNVLAPLETHLFIKKLISKNVY